MADPTLSTGFSRRAMLAGGAAAAALPVAAAPANAMAPAAMPPAAGDPDAELFRRLAAADRGWDAFLAARALAERLFKATYYHPAFARPPAAGAAGRAAFDALAERTGYRAAADRCLRQQARYLAAARHAFDLPARGLPGIAAKLRFGVAVARDGADGSYETDMFEWFDRALDDFERLTRLPVPVRGTWTRPSKDRP